MKNLNHILTALFVLLLFSGFVCAQISEPTGNGVIKITSNVEGATVNLLNADGTLIQSGTIQNGFAEFQTSLDQTITHAEVSAEGYNTRVCTVLMMNNEGVFVENIPLEASFSYERILGVVILLLLVFAGGAVIWDTRHDEG